MPPSIYPGFLQAVVAPAERIAAAYRHCVRVICSDQARILRRLPMNAERGYGAAHLCLQSRSEIQTVLLETLAARSRSQPLCLHNVSDDVGRGDGDVPAQDVQVVAEVEAIGGWSGGCHGRFFWARPAAHSREAGSVARFYFALLTTSLERQAKYQEQRQGKYFGDKQ